MRRYSGLICRYTYNPISGGGRHDDEASTGYGSHGERYFGFGSAVHLGSLVLAFMTMHTVREILDPSSLLVSAMQAAAGRRTSDAASPFGGERLTYSLRHSETGDGYRGAVAF